MLTASGPELRLNNAKGQARVCFKVVSDDEAPMILLTDSRGHPRIMLTVHHDRPHIHVMRRGARRRYIVPAVPFGKDGTPASWRRVQRAARDNDPTAFDRAALDSGFMDFEIPGLWDLARGQRQEVGGHALNARQRAARTAKRRARQAQ
jgi:hypothetical protein